MKKKLFVLMGIPGSGKSYAVDRLFGETKNLVVVSPDAIRAEMTGDAADQSKNREVFERAHLMVTTALANEDVQYVVFDATNTKKFARANLLAIAQEFDAIPSLLIFDVDFAICAARNETRDRTVPRHAMIRMQQEFGQALVEVESEPWGERNHIVSADEEGVKLRK